MIAATRTYGDGTTVTLDIADTFPRCLSVAEMRREQQKRDDDYQRARKAQRDRNSKESR